MIETHQATPTGIALPTGHCMPARKTTLTIPADPRLREREERMTRACEIANANPDVLRIEQEWDDLKDEADPVEEPSDAAPAE